MIVLDTHAWFWWAARLPQLSGSARQLIDRAEKIFISSYSVFELARLEHHGRVEFDRSDWRQRALRFDERIVEVPMDHAIAERAIDLLAKGLAGDPADQVILATAGQLGATLVTKDRVLREFAPSQTAW